MYKNNNNYSVINLNNIISKIIENKKTIIVLFLIFIFIAVALCVVLPKKYVSEAKILIKKTGSTNLSYINPFIISEDAENMPERNFFSASNSLSEDIEIIKSPIVLDRVVRENNLRHRHGQAKGKFISAKDFSRKNFSISKIKDANIIYISYKSSSPFLSYSVINSLINNYQEIQKSINTKKASDDVVFLKKAYAKTQKELNLNLVRLKKHKSLPENPGVYSQMTSASLLGIYDKRFSAKLRQISQGEVDLQELQNKVRTASEELNSIKKRLEWSSLVKNISGQASDIVILEAPVVSEEYNFCEPQPVVIFIMAILGWIAACFLFIGFKKAA